MEHLVTVGCGRCKKTWEENIDFVTISTRPDFCDECLTNHKEGCEQIVRDFWRNFEEIKKTWSKT